eukprot:COSAG01_NODE_27_length_36706_cov_155.674106_15_plen_49_part_00
MLLGLVGMDDLTYELRRCIGSQIQAMKIVYQKVLEWIGSVNAKTIHHV